MKNKILILFLIILLYSCAEDAQTDKKEINNTAKDEAAKDTTPIKLEFIILESYEDALKQAKKENKPLLLFFTCHACGNNTIQIADMIYKNHTCKAVISKYFISYAAYVDDRKPLPAKEQYISKKNGETIEQVGQKWSELQMEKFNSSSQPHFIIIDVNGNKVAEFTYEPDIVKFVAFLKEGVK